MEREGIWLLVTNGRSQGGDRDRNLGKDDEGLYGKKEISGWW